MQNPVRAYILLLIVATMAEEMNLAPDGGLNTTNTSTEWSEVSQEDMIRVSENMKQAALIGWQVRDDAQKNAQLAEFLEFLFNNIKDDAIWTLVVDLCTKPTSDKKWLTLSLYELISFFVPFFQSEAEVHGVFVAFPSLPQIASLDTNGYTEYIGKVLATSEFMQSMDKWKISTLMLSILVFFGYERPEVLSKTGSKENPPIHI